MPADLHVHTTFSDGTYTPEEIVKAAKEAQLSAVAITDHDIVDGIALAVSAAGQNGLRVIPGIEFTTEFGKAEVHILGYFIDHNSSELRDILLKLKASRDDRVKRILSNLSKAGVELSLERVMQIVGPGSAGRPHVAQALVETGYVSSIKEAFIKYLVPGKPGYEPHYKLSPHDAVSLIVKVGGVAVFAHPAISNCDEIIPELMDRGLSGLEVFYPSHGPAVEQHYLSLTIKNNLVAVGGSDFHGTRGVREISLGYKFTSDEALAELEKRKP